MSTSPDLRLLTLLKAINRNHNFTITIDTIKAFRALVKKMTNEWAVCLAKHDAKEKRKTTRESEVNAAMRAQLLAEEASEQRVMRQLLQRPIDELKGALELWCALQVHVKYREMEKYLQEE